MEFLLDTAIEVLIIDKFIVMGSMDGLFDGVSIEFYIVLGVGIEGNWGFGVGQLHTI